MKAPANNSELILVRQFKDESCENGSIEDSFLYEKSIMHRIGVGYLCLPKTNSIMGLLKDNAEFNTLLRSGSGSETFVNSRRKIILSKTVDCSFSPFRAVSWCPLLREGWGVCRQFQGTMEFPMERSKKSCLESSREETWWDSWGSLLFDLVHPE